MASPPTDSEILTQLQQDFAAFKAEVYARMAEKDAQIEALLVDLEAERERGAELENWAISQFDNRARILKGAFVNVKDNLAIAVGLVGLAIALWGATPSVREKTADTWITGITAACMGAISVSIQRRGTGDREATLGEER